MSLANMIASNPMLIADIKNPPLNLQAEAIRSNPYAYLYIDSPRYTIEKMAVQLCPQLINVIDNPFPETLIGYFEKYPYEVTKYSKKIDENVLIELIERDFAIILLINNGKKCEFKQEITYNMVCAAVKKKPSIIFNIMVEEKNKKFFTKELLFIAVEKEWDDEFYRRLLHEYLTTQYCLNEYNVEEEYEITHKINKMKLMKGPMR